MYSYIISNVYIRIPAPTGAAPPLIKAASCSRQRPLLDHEVPVPS